MEYMKYSRAELYTCAEMVEKYLLKWQGHRMKKAEFFTRACELEKCYNYAADNLNTLLFADSTYMKESYWLLHISARCIKTANLKPMKEMLQSISAMS